MKEHVLRSIIIDSSGWLEYIAAGDKADLFAPYFEQNADKVLVPTIVIFEVHRALERVGPCVAEQFLQTVYGLPVIDVDVKVAFAGAEFAMLYKLNIARSLLYACATNHRAELVTCDQAFADLPNVTLL